MNDETVFSYPQEVIDELRQEAVRKATSTTHKWKQRGVYVYCTACEYEHGVYVGTDKILVGEKDGKPIVVAKS